MPVFPHVPGWRCEPPAEKRGMAVRARMPMSVPRMVDASVQTGLDGEARRRLGKQGRRQKAEGRSGSRVVFSFAFKPQEVVKKSTCRTSRATPHPDPLPEG